LTCRGGCESIGVVDRPGAGRRDARIRSCWWEITGDKATYHVRKRAADPHYPPGVENARSQRTGRGIISDRWSIATHEFITEKAGYAGQKFRVVVEVEVKDAKK